MLTGTVPFKAPNMKELHVLISTGTYKYPFNLSKEAKAVVDGMLCLDPAKRFTLPQILSH